MRKLLTLLLLWSSFALAQSAGFIEGNTLGVTAGYPAQESPPPLVYFNAVSGEDGLPSNVWTTYTVPNVPDDTKAIFLTGLLVITNPTVAAPYGETADMHVYFRAPGAMPTPPQTIIDFPCQTIIVGWGGQRSGCSLWVPVVNRQFQVWWYRSTPCCYPEHSAYGAKFYVNAYLR